MVIYGQIKKDIGQILRQRWRCLHDTESTATTEIYTLSLHDALPIFYGQIKKDIGQILRQLCEQKGIEIIEAEACPDQIGRAHV